MTCTCLVLQWTHAHAPFYGSVDFTRFSYVKVNLGSRGRCRVLFTPGNLGIISVGPIYRVFICYYSVSCRPLGAQLQGFERLLRAAVTCCLESIIYLSATLACSSRLPMTMIQYASGVRGLQNPRQNRGLQVQTLRRLPTSEVTA